MGLAAYEQVDDTGEVLRNFASMGWREGLPEVCRAQRRRTTARVLIERVQGGLDSINSEVGHQSQVWRSELGGVRAARSLRMFGLHFVQDRAWLKRR